MSTLPIDYNSLTSLLLSSDPPAIPYDVTFLIFDEDKVKQGEVQAHKITFALNSPVLRNKFCGAGNFADKNDKEVEVIGSLEAFRLLTSFLYNKPTTIVELSVDKVFDVVSLAHFYDIGKLEEALEHRLEKIVIGKDDVIEAVKKAEEFAMFERASQALLKNCAMTLQKAFNDDAEKFVEFRCQVADTGDEAVCLRLLAMIKNLPPLLCSNCQKSPCVSGAEVTSSAQVRKGTRLTPSPRYCGWNPGYGRTEVVSVVASRDTVKVQAGDGTLKFDTNYFYPVKYGCGWRFDCAGS